MVSKNCRSDVLKKDFLEECFEVNFETGTLTWKFRPRHHFSTERGWKITNRQRAGKVANLLWKKSENYVCQRVTTGCKHFSVQHVIWTMFYGEMIDTKLWEIDHIDRNPMNNSIKNLRKVSRAENSYNTSGRLSSNTTSEFKGVCFDSNRQRWVLQFSASSFTIRGRFNDEQSAAYMYRILSEEFHGEFSPDFLKEVKFPDIFDWQGLTTKMRTLLEEMSDSSKKNHTLLFDGLEKKPWKKIARATNTGVARVTLVTPSVKSEKDKRKFIAVCDEKGRKSFTVNKYGYDEAFRLACEWVGEL